MPNYSVIHSCGHTQEWTFRSKTPGVNETRCEEKSKTACSRCIRTELFTHGGKREGAGRKPSPIPKKYYKLYLTESEHTTLRATLARLREGETEMTTLILKNDFHNTTANVRLSEDGYLSEQQTKRIKNKLCSGNGCTCSNDLGTRGMQDREIEIQLIGDSKKYVRVLTN